jgi:hypothetical protein
MSTHLYEVVLQGTLFNQLIVNRWNYRSDGDDVPSGNSFGLATAMGFTPTAGAFPADTIGNGISGLAGSEMVFQQAIVRAVYVPTDFVDIPFNPGVVGQGAAGNTEPPFIALGFRTNRVRQDIGRGYKRFAGVTESEVDDAGDVAGGTLTAALALADLMSDVISFTEDALTISFTPCIVKKQLYVAPSGKNAYRYIPVADGGESAQLELIATGITWQPYEQVRSQVSRQYGKGA